MLAKSAETDYASRMLCADEEGIYIHDTEAPTSPDRTSYRNSFGEMPFDDSILRITAKSRIDHFEKKSYNNRFSFME